MKIIDRVSSNAWQEFHIADGAEEIAVINKECPDFLVDHISRIKQERVDTGLGRLQAKLPPLLYVKLMQEGVFKNQKSLRKWLNDPDNRKWRVSGGKL